MQIEISTRHGGLESEQQRYLHDKAEKLLKYFGRLMAIEVAVDHGKHGWEVEILVSAEHKHDFVASEAGSTPEAAMDLAFTRSSSSSAATRKRSNTTKAMSPMAVHHPGRPSNPEHPKRRKPIPTRSDPAPTLNRSPHEQSPPDATSRGLVSPWSQWR